LALGNSAEARPMKAREMMVETRILMAGFKSVWLSGDRVKRLQRDQIASNWLQCCKLREKVRTLFQLR
jgi:hypothetical protein